MCVHKKKPNAVTEDEDESKVFLLLGGELAERWLPVRRAMDWGQKTCVPRLAECTDSPPLDGGWGVLRLQSNTSDPLLPRRLLNRITASGLFPRGPELNRVVTARMNYVLDIWRCIYPDMPQIYLPPPPLDFFLSSFFFKSSPKDIFPLLLVKETSMWERSIDWLPPVCARTIQAPDGGSNLQPRYVPWPGVETATFQ